MIKRSPNAVGPSAAARWNQPVNRSNAAASGPANFGLNKDYVISTPLKKLAIMDIGKRYGSQLKWCGCQDAPQSHWGRARASKP